MPHRHIGAHGPGTGPGTEPPIPDQIWMFWASHCEEWEASTDVPDRIAYVAATSESEAMAIAADLTKAYDGIEHTAVRVK